MSWDSAIKLLVNTKKVSDTLGKVEQVRDYANKLNKSDPKKVKKDDIKVFTNKTMSDLLTEIRVFEKSSKEALKDNFNLPETGKQKVLEFAAKTEEKFGTDSHQLKTAMKGYLLQLEFYEKSLRKLSAQLESPELENNATAFDGMQKCGRDLKQAFIAVAKNLPPLLGTGQNAMFYALSDQASEFAGIAQTVASNLRSIASRNDTNVEKVEKEIENNEAWIVWTNNERWLKKGEIKKNLKAKTPK